MPSFHRPDNIRVAVIIPAFNEEQSIANVLNDIPGDQVNEVVVCNNASSDQTARVAESSGATVVHEDRKGYGYACLKGMAYLQAKPENEQPDIVVFLDGDYSDHPEQIVDVLQPILSGGMELVIGSRALGQRTKGAMLPQQIFGNWLSTQMMKWIYGSSFTDLGPFRAIRWKSLLALDMQDKTYGWTVEMQVKALKHGLACTEVPVDYRKRIGVSKVTGTVKGTIMAGIKIIFTIFKYM